MSVRSKKKEASFDVIVVGGGMTGMCAAIASARHGAKTALVQERPVFGGNASSEIRMHICGASANMVKPNAEETGILREILLENKRVNDYYNYSVWDRVLFTAIREQKNLSMFLNTTMHDVDTEGHRITAIHCYQMTTEIEWTLRAPVFCDCTGNGTLGFMAGMPFRTGSEGKAEYQEPHAPEQPDQHRMGNTLLFKAVDRGHPVAFVPPKGSYTFTEEQLRYRKHADAKPLFGVLEAENKADPILDNVDNTTKDMVFDAYCLDYGYWWIELTGEKADIIGRVCMDQLMLDVSNINGVKEGDVVTVFGKDGKMILTVDELAKKIGTINYEIVCLIGKRVPRIYFYNNEVIGKVIYI